MIKPRIGVPPEAVRQTARHTLFVEGSSPATIDPTVLDALLGNLIIIKPLGSSFHIRSAAEALHPHHPDYYFLIDRDHQSEEDVEKSWNNFPDSKTQNLLIWRKRELENYFLSPDYLWQCDYINCSRDKLEAKLLQVARQRIFLDVANHIITQVREALKAKWVETFPSITGFETRAKACAALLSRSEFVNHSKLVKQRLGKKVLATRFDEIADIWLGDAKFTEPIMGKGIWLEMIRGKAALRTIINDCFKVYDANRKVIQGDRKLSEVVKNLLQKPLEDQPEDFQKLYQMISDRVRS
jgi:hypothetical protein